MIKTGMLWFDDSKKRSLGAKIEMAREHYRQKYGEYPDVCYTHPDELVGADAKALPLKTVAAKEILPHHFWLGHHA